MFLGEFLEEVVDVSEGADIADLGVVAEHDAEFLLKPHDHIHQIEAVQLEVFYDLLVGRQIGFLHLEALDEDRVYRSDDFAAIHCVVS